MRSGDAIKRATWHPRFPVYPRRECVASVFVASVFYFCHPPCLAPIQNSKGWVTIEVAPPALG